MSSGGQREIQTQRRVVAFFRNALGYAYLGYWKDRKGNANVRWCTSSSGAILSVFASSWTR